MGAAAWESHKFTREPCYDSVCASFVFCLKLQQNERNTLHEAILLEIGLYLLEIGLRPLPSLGKMDWPYRQKVAREGGIAAKGCAQTPSPRGKSSVVRPPELYKGAPMSGFSDRMPP